MRKLMKEEKLTEYMYVLLGLMLGALLLLLTSDFAMAQSSDWVKPAGDLIGDLQSGLIQIGIPVVGLGIIILGIWAAITGRIDWMRMAMIAMAGLLITAGPTIMGALLE